MDFSNMPSDPMKSYWPYIISLVVGIVTIIKSYMSGTECPNKERLDGKLVIVTGAGGGIGLETAKELAKRGAQVIMCVRDTSQAEEVVEKIMKKVPAAKLTLKKLDLTCIKSIEDFVKSLENTKVDILINNAGVCFHPYKITEDGHELHMATNYLGHFLLTHLLLKNLEMSEQGRIINVCAGVTSSNTPSILPPPRETYTSKEAYLQSKLAIVMITKYLPQVLHNTKITINCLNPGLVRATGHNRHSVHINHWGVYLALMPWMWLLMKTPRQGAQTSIYLATESTLKTTTGKYFNNCNEETTWLDEETADKSEMENLYNKTCKLLNIQPLLAK